MLIFSAQDATVMPSTHQPLQESPVPGTPCPFRANNLESTANTELLSSDVISACAWLDSHSDLQTIMSRSSRQAVSGLLNSIWIKHA